MGRVIVVGSVNVDLVVRTARLPAAGETVVGGDLARHHGGKGANQAVAAARLGASVAFVGAVGGDDFGRDAARALADEGIDTSRLTTVDRPTGVALIVVDEAGQNLIAVAPGANADLTADMVAQAMESLALSAGDLVLVSREVPPDAARTALAGGRAAGATTILNPAPAAGLDRETRRLADVLTPNRTELATISGTSAPGEAADLLLDEEGSRWLAVTLGAAGAELVERGGQPIVMRAPAVEAVDATGAGDCFNGALAAMLAAGRPVAEAVAQAVRAASLSTEREGARDGMPTAERLRQLGASDGRP